MASRTIRRCTRDRAEYGAAVAALDEPDRAEQRGVSADAGERVQSVLDDDADTFGVDPNFRVGYLQTWNLKVQRDLPGRCR
jgi:hypothetical protein